MFRGLSEDEEMIPKDPRGWWVIGEVAWRADIPLMDGESLRAEENGRQVGAQDTDMFTTSTIFLFTNASPELGILEGLV